MFVRAAIANIRWFREKRASLFFVSLANRGAFTAGAAMPVIVAGITEPVINLTISAVDAIVKWSVWSAFLFEDDMSFDLFRDCSAVFSEKAANSFKTHSFFQRMLDSISVIKG